MRGALLFSLLAVASVSARALDLDAAALAKLKAGEPVTAFTPDKAESAAGVLQAVVDIPAAPPVVWKLLTDCNLNLKVFNGLTACRIVSREADGSDVREHTISWSRLLPTLKSSFRSTYEPMTSIRFEKTAGDLKRLSGQWVLAPIPDNGGTRLSYKADIAVGIPVPAMLVKAALEGDMPKTMKAIRKAAIDGLGG